jgi:photosynthetic reaction center H subunit
MEIGAITEYIDAAQVVLYVFWAFFFYIIYYLVQENKREGYPLDSDSLDPAGRRKIAGVTSVPSPKIFEMEDGTIYTAPDASRADTRVLKAQALSGTDGFPVEPEGNPLLAGVGPGSYAERDDVPDLTIHGTPKIIPMRIAEGFHVDENDPDPRGMPVIGADGKSGGVVTDLWVDPPEHLIRFLEVQVAEGNTVLFPINLVRISRRDGEVTVRVLQSHQFADIPQLKNPHQVTRLEEEKIFGYFGAGTLYGMPGRTEPLV